MEKRHKVFIGINLPKEIKKNLAKKQEDLVPKFGEIAKWTRTDNLHITLDFLGYLTDEEISDVCRIVGEIANDHESFSIKLNKIIYGPKDKNTLPAGRQAPKMIWAVGEKSEEFSNLRKKIAEALLGGVGLAVEGKASSPHITLARLSAFGLRQMDEMEVPEVDENIDLLFTVESIEVMEPQFKKGGPVYTILESCPLKN